MRILTKEAERLAEMTSREAMSATALNGAQVVVYDDVLVMPCAYADRARTSDFHSVAVGAATFHGIADAMNPSLPRWLRDRFPNAWPTLSFFRESPAGQVEPNFVHTDRDMGDWTAILYLTEHPAEGDGTMFWRDRRTGEIVSHETDVHDEGARWADRDRWEMEALIGAKFNRCVVFSSALFHSRALFENYGTAGKNARLVQIVFGTGSLEQP